MNSKKELSLALLAFLSTVGAIFTMRPASTSDTPASATPTALRQQVYTPAPAAVTVPAASGLTAADFHFAANVNQSDLASALTDIR